MVEVLGICVHSSTSVQFSEMQHILAVVQEPQYH